jgi:hypothetical protein
MRDGRRPSSLPALRGVAARPAAGAGLVVDGGQAGLSARMTPAANGFQYSTSVA